LASHATPTPTPIQIRVARHTDRLPELIAFYRDGIGLREVGGFRDHDGYDGVFLEIPGTAAHLEFTSGGGHRAPAPHAESLLVLYLGDRAAVRAVAARLDGEPVEPANPYWAEHAVTFEDPDGFRVVLVPEAWASDAAAEPSPRIAGHRPIRIERYTGPRAALRPSFELADNSAQELDAYIDAGRVLVAVCGDGIVGHLQLTDTERPDAAEVKNMAVAEAFQRRGLGRSLMTAAIDLARREGRSTVVVATAAAATDTLRFYQRLGFRMARVERDAFGPATGYAPGLELDGIELRDRVWLDRRVDESGG